MANSTDGKIFRIFIASPGDLSDERQAARRAIERANRVLAGSKTNWRIELLAWEDTLPGYARPQEIINQEVDICNLFVGLLWKRWGQPTGKFSSGFEEEYYRARDRRAASQEPEMWIFLKKVEKDQLEDPGEQLQKTLAFRQKLQESREVLYKEFVNTEEWETTFFDSLLQHILKNIIPSYPAQPPSSVPVSEVAAELDKGDVAELDFPKELDKAIGKMREAIIENTSIERVDVSRVFLTSFSLISPFTNEVLSTHEINLIYRSRKDYQLLDREKSLIFRTIIADQYNYCPGWYWLSDSDSFDYKGMLAFRAIYDGNLIVRKQSLELLMAHKILDMSPIFPRTDFLPRILDKDNPKEVIDIALNYLNITGKSDEKPLLDVFVNDPESENYDKALIAYISILSRENIDAAFRLMLEKIGLNTRDWIKSFQNQEGSLDEHLLIEGSHHPNKYVRLFAAKELYRRKALSLEEAKTLKNDDWAPVREVAFKVVIQHGETVEVSDIKNSFKGATSSLDSHLFPLFLSAVNPPVDEDEVLFELFCTYSKEKLNGLIYDFASDGHVAYRALAHTYYEEMSDRILNDLETGFRALLEELITAINAKWGDTAKEIIDGLHGDLGKYLINKYIASSLSIVVEKGDSRFTEIARKCLDSENDMVKYYSLKVLEKLGNESDVENIVRVGKQSSIPGIKFLAAKTALTLSDKSIDILMDFLHSRDTDLIKASRDMLMVQDENSVEELLKPLLYSDHEITRLIVVYYFINKFNREKLTELLEGYPARDYYYYNVVCWLDRALYSPEDLWPNFLEQLREQLN